MADDTYRTLRVRRDALPTRVDFQLCYAEVGNRVDMLFYDVPLSVVITELTNDWVEFRSYNTPAVEQSNADLWRD